MTAPDPRLGEIAARLAEIQEDGAKAAMWRTADVAFLLAVLADRDAKLTRVEALAAALDHTEHGGNAERSDTCWACQRQNYGARSPWPCIYHNHAQRIRAAVADTTGGEGK